MHVYVWQAEQFWQLSGLICPWIENNLKLSTLGNVVLRSETGRELSILFRGVNSTAVYLYFITYILVSIYYWIKTS